MEKKMKMSKTAAQERNAFGVGKNEVLVDASKTVVLQDVPFLNHKPALQNGVHYSNVANYKKTKGSKA